MTFRLAAVAALAFTAGAAAQFSTITYQGKLTDGSGLAATYDMVFKLFDDEAVGAPDTQIGAAISRPGVAVAADGTFTQMLDFPDSSLSPSATRWLQIEVRRAGVGLYTVLTPRQAFTSAPYAVRASTLELPAFLSGQSSADNNFLLVGRNSRVSGGGGIAGEGTYWGMVARGGTVTSWFPTTPGTGIQGLGATVGVAGDTDSGSGTGVWGRAVDGTGGLFEVFNSVNPGTGTALRARNLGDLGVAAWVENQAPSNAAPALRVDTVSTQQNAFAVHATVVPTAPGGFSTALRGQNLGTGGNGIGVWGSQAGSGWGVYGTVGEGGRAIYGVGGGTTGYAGYFSGRVNITGSLTKGSGTFRIDHPLDPENKYLSHSFVESPDMMNIYNGLITTDGEGMATVTLPDYFQALNMDYRYQLTVVDDADSAEFVQAKVVHRIEGNRFSIRTSRPGTVVSWQVTGVRNDAYAKIHRVVVEEPKIGSEVGKYLHPDAFGLPASRAINPPAFQQN